MAELKLGPISLTFGENGKKRKPDTTERGAPGTVFLSGQLTEEEYNADLRGAKAIQVYDRMRRSDGQVKATLLVCELPLRSATWSVEPASDEPMDVEVGQFIEDNLFDGMTITWDSFLHHVLLKLTFGFSIFEKVFEIDGNRVKWRKFAPRLPKTLWNWKLDPNGGLKGIVQLVFKDDKFDYIDIDADKLLVFTHEKEGSNFEGISLLRAAYKHYYYKDHLYRIDAIASERHAMGIPYFKHPGEISQDEKNRLDQMGQHLYAHEQQYVRLAEEYDFRVEGLTGSIKDLNPSIQHHDNMIARSILAQFINLGSADVGSFALARDQSSFFLMALKSVGRNICDTMNRYAIPQLVDYNFNVKAYPKLRVSGLETRKMDEYAKAILDLASAGAITMDRTVQETLRDMLGLPPIPEEEEPAEEASVKGIGFAERKRKRELTYAETFVNFGEIEKVLNSAEEKFLRTAKEIQERQIANLTEVAIKAIENKDTQKLEDIEVRYKTDMADRMLIVLKEMYEYGRVQVKRELQSQRHVEYMGLPDPLDPANVLIIMEFLKARSRANSTVMSNKLKQSVIFQGLNQIKKGVVDKPGLLSNLKALSDKELIATAQYSVNESFNFGRGTEADNMKDEIDRVQYSALLDAHTCSVCEPLDGQEWGYEDPRTARYASGNPDCLGGGRCRCVLVFISKQERKR